MFKYSTISIVEVFNRNETVSEVCIVPFLYVMIPVGLINEKY